MAAFILVGVAIVSRILNSEPCTIALSPSACVKLETVSTHPARQAGLSGRKHLAAEEGMLFVFESPLNACMWMKDMRFNIDIVWVDHAKKIIRIKKDVGPDTYPESFCAQDTLYVIELASGVAEQTGLRVGQQLKI